VKTRSHSLSSFTSWDADGPQGGAEGDSSAAKYSASIYVATRWHDAGPSGAWKPRITKGAT
jgi:hypothetical protein